MQGRQNRLKFTTFLSQKQLLYFNFSLFPREAAKKQISTSNVNLRRFPPETSFAVHFAIVLDKKWKEKFATGTRPSPESYLMSSPS